MPAPRVGRENRTPPPDPSRSDRLRIVVYGLPAPQGSKRFVGIAKNTGRGILVESSKRAKPWRQDVESAAREAMGYGACPAFDGPLVARMVFTLPKPRSAPKSRRTYPDRKPDLSKLCRSTEDALRDGGAIADDARIVRYAELAKVFPGEDVDALKLPGVVIELWRIPAWELRTDRCAIPSIEETPACPCPE